MASVVTELKLNVFTIFLLLCCSHVDQQFGGLTADYAAWCRCLTTTSAFFVKEYFPVPSSGGNQCKTGVLPFGILANHKIKMCHNSVKKIMIQKITQNNWNF